MVGEETVGVRWGDGRVPELILLAEGAELAVVEVLEYWQNPRYGEAADATLPTTRAYRLLVSDPAGIAEGPREVNIRQYGGRHPDAWYLRLAHDSMDNEQTRDALREALVERCRESFTREWSSRSRTETMDNLASLNAGQGFVLTVGGWTFQGVRFPADEFEQILRDAAER